MANPDGSNSFNQRRMSGLSTSRFTQGRLYSRSQWDEDLFVGYVGRDLWYFDKSKMSRPVADDSSVWGNTDFIESKRRQTTKPKVEKMIKNVNYVGGEYNVVACEGINQPLMEAVYAKIDADIIVEKGDFVVLETESGYELAQIGAVLENKMENAAEVKKAKCWVVDKVNRERHNDRVVNTERREYIIQQLEEKKAAVETISMYNLLAEMDPNAKKLLEELKELGA